jgi:CHAT domain-containing protein
VRFGGEALATTKGISYCSSATLLHRCFERNQARRFDTQAWSFPVNGDGDRPAGPPVRTCLSYGVDVLTDKDSAYQELASAFASHFPETSLARNRSDVKNALNPSSRIQGADPAHVSPDVICLVCHGHVDALHLDRSGLLLQGSPGWTSMRSVLVHGNTNLRIQDHPFAEIPLWLEPVRPSSSRGIFEPEIMTTGEMQVGCASDAQLVALFGCSTGSGAVGSNDDYLSLACQWLKIGAASVIANLWEADLAVLTEWSHRFIKHWTQLHQPKAIAAREATRTLLADRPGLADQLELWGCIALLGDWL